MWNTLSGVQENTVTNGSLMHKIDFKEKQHKTSHCMSLVTSKPVLVNANNNSTPDICSLDMASKFHMSSH